MTLTKEKIFRGLLTGIVEIVQNPDDDGIACQIGNFWFNFIGQGSENLTVNEVYEIFTKENLADMVLDATKYLNKTETDYITSCLDKKLEFTKDDLKTGMVVELRDGSRCIYTQRNIINVESRFIGIDDVNYNILYFIDYFNDNLTCNDYSEYDIMKIYPPMSDQPIWIRQEPILTQEEHDYLLAVIKPFRNRVSSISKINLNELELIKIQLDNDRIQLPLFKSGLMYQNMNKNIAYTLEELKL